MRTVEEIEADLAIARQRLRAMPDGKARQEDVERLEAELAAAQSE